MFPQFCNNSNVQLQARNITDGNVMLMCDYFILCLSAITCKSLPIF